jgi:hypothetical protein
MLGRYGTSVGDAREAHHRLPPGDSEVEDVPVPAARHAGSDRWFAPLSR